MTSASFDPRGFDAEPDILEPERASLLAILALVFGLICFIPFLGVIAIICGIAGLIVINRSRGRLAGTGMAIAGLILGLLFTALWGAVLLGAAQAFSMFSREFVKPVNEIVQAIEQKDFATTRQRLDAQVQVLATDEAIAKFSDVVSAELGAFRGVPEGFDLFSAYAEIGQLIQNNKNLQGQGRQDRMIPMPAKFDKGNALIMLWFEPPQGGQKTPPTAGSMFTFQNITIITQQSVHNLIDPALIQPPVPGVLPGVPPVTDPNAPPADPSAPDAPTPEAEKTPEHDAPGGGN
jgi:hypothetical protein